MAALYMDVHVPAAITRALRLRGIDVLTAQEDGTARLPDPELLDRATELSRVLVSQDTDLLQEATLRQKQGRPFAGVIFAPQSKTTIGQCVTDLELIAIASEPQEYIDRVQYLPL